MDNVVKLLSGLSYKVGQYMVMEMFRLNASFIYFLGWEELILNSLVYPL